MDSLTGTQFDVLVTALTGYLIGSIPIANMVARRRGVADLREIGDRNPGYWNARELLGRRAAIPVMVGDVAKGTAAAATGLLLADDGVWALAYVGTGAAMLGHAYPILAGFRGGRSVLTFAGGALLYSPISFAIAFGALLLAFAVARSFAIGARIGVVAFPIAQLFVDGPYRTAATGVLMSFIGLRFAMAGRSPSRNVPPSSR